MGKTGNSLNWDPGETTRSGIGGIFRLIRIEHTLFSLPFAYMGAFLCGRPDFRELLWITLAVFGLRTAAMAFNNIADLEIDRKNPRSRKRPLVTGAVSPFTAWMLVLLGSILYFLSAYFLNWPSFVMSPVPFVFAMSYPFAKRFHNWPHIHLGFVLALVVLGGSFGVLGDKYSNILKTFSLVPWEFMFALIFWVAGFDIIYSIMDMEFDREEGLGSVPAGYGLKFAKWIAPVFHLFTFVLIFVGMVRFRVGFISYPFVILSMILVFYGHLKVWKSLSNIKVAFNLNLFVGLLISIGIILGS